MFDLNTVTRGEGFFTRDQLLARYEELSGRSMSDLRWYQALAIWKAAVFMEGNYKRSVAGTTDDPYLKLFDEGVPQLAETALEDHPVAATRLVKKGLLTDFGGVLTTNVFDAFRAFCRVRGARPGRRSERPSASSPRRWRGCAGSSGARSRWRSTSRTSRPRSAWPITRASSKRLFAGVGPDEPMVDAVRRATGRRASRPPWSRTRGAMPPTTRSAGTASSTRS